jgi:thioredoxin reductase (NADPH)
MSQRPVILIVDDDPSALSQLLEALDRRFGGDYRVVACGSAREAVQQAERLAREGEELALVIADQWMPELTGLALLDRVHELHRNAKRALLVAWGDRGAAPAILEGCAFGRLENYLYKPWVPAEVHLYPPVSEFLAEWTMAHRPRMELVRVVGAEPSPRAHELRELLERNGIPYGAYPADSDEGRDLLARARLGTSRLPVVLLLDGSALLDPSNAELADALGSSDAHASSCDLLIVGGGPGGLAAAVYGASEGLRTIVVEREAMGGQAGTSTLIRNYLGFPRGISGAELAQRAYQQAWLFAAKYVFARAVTALRADVDGDGAAGRRRITLSDGREIAAGAVLIATGASYRRLDVPTLDPFVGAGVFYTSMGQDTRVIRDRNVYVAGGGNSAGQAVLHLSKHARKVTLLVRGRSLKASMSSYLAQDLLQRSNVEVLFETEVVGGEGAQRLERIALRDGHGQTRTVPLDMLFVLIGADPHTQWLDGAVARDAHGFVFTGEDVPRAACKGHAPGTFETSMPGVFAVGDVRVGSVKRVASAVGEGASAIAQVHRYLARVRDRGGRVST